jgi:hypothetical protein
VIIYIMAVRRCPYCKAIIDEEDKYCNNCGTQLLFPEDETIEEDIPGDKIVEEEEQETEEDLTEEKAQGLADEEEDEEQLVEEPGRENFSLEGETGEIEEEEGEEEEIEGERRGEFLEDTSEDEKVVREEEDLIEEREDEGELEAIGSETSVEETEDEGADITEAERETSGWPFDEESAEEDNEGKAEDSEEAETEEVELAEEELGEEEIEQPPSDRFVKDEAEKKFEVSIEEDELVIKTKDQDRLTGSVEEGKREIDDLLSTYDRAKPTDEEMSPTREDSHPPFRAEEPSTETKEDLPPWASGMKEIPSSSLQEEKTEGEETSTRREWTTDSGVGFPERLTQNTLPFSDTSVQRIEEERVEEEAEKPEAGQRPPALSSRLRAKLVDVVFITALWLISLWFTAQIIGVSFFRLIFGSLVPVLAFYLILLILYFFLFLYFLGETLGDHYFSEED